MRWMNVQSQETNRCAQVESQSPLPPARRIIIGPDQTSHRDATHRTLLIHNMDPEGAVLEISTLTRLCPVPDYTRPQSPETPAYPLPRLVRQCLS